MHQFIPLEHASACRHVPGEHAIGLPSCFRILSFRSKPFLSTALDVRSLRLPPAPTQQNVVLSTAAVAISRLHGKASKVNGYDIYPLLHCCVVYSLQRHGRLVVWT